MDQERFSYTTRCKWCNQTANREFPKPGYTGAPKSHEDFVEFLKSLVTPTMLIQLNCRSCGGPTLQDLVSYQQKGT